MHFDQPVTYKKRNARGENFRHTWHVDSLRVVVAPLGCYVAAPEDIVQKVWVEIPARNGAEVLYFF